jgi:ubiquinone/menaquinone biosynthesis C-methylase UbiE
LPVADVGAGNGELTAILAAEVGRSGRVYSSDIDPGSLDRVRAAVGAAGHTNVTLLLSEAGNANLPDGCCDAIVMRRVYHHLTDAAAINASLLRALRPGGVLAVIDFPAPLPWPPVLNHGADVSRVVAEVVASGFVQVRVIDDWPGRGPLPSYCAVFTKPRSSHASR